MGSVACDNDDWLAHLKPSCVSVEGRRFLSKDEKERLEKVTVCDVVNHPSHYTAGKIECIDALEAATEGLTGIEAVCTANAIKYLWRWKHKNGAEDLKKAQWYINRLIERTEKD